MKARVLLVGESPQGLCGLAARLLERGCNCEFATSYEEAHSVIGAQEFDLVLSPVRLCDTNLFALTHLLEGSACTLFYYHAVEEGCWWLPARRLGQECFGSSGLRSHEIVNVLDEIIEEILVRRQATGNMQQSQPRSLFAVPSSRGKSPPVRT